MYLHLCMAVEDQLPEVETPNTLSGYILIKLKAWLFLMSVHSLIPRLYVG